MKKGVGIVFLAFCMSLMLLPITAWATAELPDGATAAVADMDASETMEATPPLTGVTDKLPELKALEYEEANTALMTGTIVESGECGDNVTWMLDNEGTLTISGTGTMRDYSFDDRDTYYSTAPWGYNYSDIKNIRIERGVTSIGNKAFYRCVNLMSVTIPASVTSIGNYALESCTKLINVNIPDSVTSIGYGAFMGCSALTSLTIPNKVTSIGSQTFWGCKGLTNVAIPNSVTSLGDWAFKGCIGLRSVTIPRSVTSIGNYAFSGCSGLTSIIIPDSVTSIYAYPFGGCHNLKDIYYSGNRQQWYAITYGMSFSKDVVIHYDSSGPNDNGDSNNPDMPDTPNTPDYSKAYPVILTDYDSVQKQVTFDSMLSYKITDETTLPDADLASLVGKYVMVETGKKSPTVANIDLLKVTALDDSRLGRVSDVTDSTITIDGTIYPRRTEMWVSDYVVGQEVLYHLYHGTVVYLHYSTEVTGCLEEWDGTKNQLTIAIKQLSVDHRGFPTNYLTDMSFLGHIDQLVGWNVKCLTAGGYALRVTQIADEQEESKQYRRYDAAARVAYFADGTSYAVGNGVTLDVSGLRENVWVICTIRSAPGEGTRLVKMVKRPVEAPYRIVVGDQQLTVGKKNTLYAAIALKVFEQTIPNDPVDSVEWVSADKSVVAFDKNGATGSVTHSKDGQSLTKLIRNSHDSADSVKIYAISSGTTTVTCTLRSGEVVVTDTFRVTALSKQATELMERAKKWRTAYQSYIDALKAKMAKEGDSGTVISIEKQADELWNADNEARKQRKPRLVTFVNPNDEANETLRQYVYQAVAQFLRDKTDTIFSAKNIKVSDVKDPIKFGNQVAMEVIRTIDASPYPYTPPGSSVELLVDGVTVGTAFARHVSYNDRVIASLNSSPGEAQEAISAFVQELLKLEESVVRQAYKELLKEVFPTDIKTLANKAAKDKVTEILQPYNEKLIASGYGNVLQGLKNCFDYYEHLKDIIELGDKLSSGATDINTLLNDSLKLMEKVEFETESIKDWSIKSAMKGIKSGKKSLDDWLSGMAGKSEVTKVLYEIYQIAYEFRCPVSVSVYNSSGTQIGYVGDDDLWYDEDAIYIEHYGDAKTVYSYGEPLTFNVTGTDSGALNCTVEEYDGGEAVGRLNYYDIPLYDGKQISLAASGEAVTEASITVMSEGATIAADESLTANEYEASTVSVSCSANIAAGGEIWGGGDYVRGDAVTLQAITEDGYVFLGWRMGNGALASASPVYEFTAREDVALTALFGEYEAETSNSLAAIRGADSRLGGGTVNVTATVYYADGVDATAYCAFYDGDGRLLSVDVETLTDGEDNSLSFESRDVSAHTAKIIVFSGQRIPLCASRTVRIQ